MNQLEILEKMMGNNPLFSRAKQMAEGKTEDELKEIANNLCSQRGISLEEAFKEFKKQFKL